jgi:hypothetical protein
MSDGYTLIIFGSREKERNIGKFLLLNANCLQVYGRRQIAQHGKNLMRSSRGIWRSEYEVFLS